MKAFRIANCENWNDSQNPGSGLARMILHFARPFFVGVKLAARKGAAFDSSNARPAEAGLQSFPAEKPYRSPSRQLRRPRGGAFRHA
jgi:hypothetical protein